MLILDENITNKQRELLIENKVRVRQIGHEIGNLGMDDNRIITLLHKTTNATFFTRDLGFYNSNIIHHSYCIVVVQSQRDQVADLIIDFLKIPNFKTNASRLGKVILVSSREIKYYSLPFQDEQRIKWN